MKFGIKSIESISLVSPKCDDHYVTVQKWEYVTKEEFEKFILEYPKSLERDFYMDWYSYNDFSNRKVWPESMVAMESHIYNEDIYKIWKGEYEKIFIPARDSSEFTFANITPANLEAANS